MDSSIIYKKSIMNSDIIYKKANDYVTSLFERVYNPNLIFHNLWHTKTVVERTQEIAGHYHLNERDMMVLYVSAWFHDTGYLFVDARQHEEKSIELMKEFIKDYTTEDELIAEIEKC